jgi:hypothetical protein
MLSSSATFPPLLTLSAAGIFNEAGSEACQTCAGCLGLLGTGHLALPAARCLNGSCPKFSAQIHQPATVNPQLTALQPIEPRPNDKSQVAPEDSLSWTGLDSPPITRE